MIFKSFVWEYFALDIFPKNNEFRGGVLYKIWSIMHINIQKYLKLYLSSSFNKVIA